MIRVFVFGGLGNQMFQYAAARALADRLGVGVCIDKSLLNIRSKNVTHRIYELDLFFLKHHEKIISSKKRGFLLRKIYPKIKKTSLGRRITKCYNLYEELESSGYDPEFLSQPDHTSLSGYFQSEKYFIPFQEIVRRCFTFKNHLYGKNKDIAEKIKDTNSVSIHIRRGDYVSNKKSAAIYTELSTEYYEKAIERIRQEFDNPTFFVFSDDPEEAKKTIPTLHAVHINWNKGRDSYIDMQLMSLCKHNIIANSSFSWWGAWLNNNENKIVIAPDQWLKNPEENDRIRDLIPDRWIKI
ncbi:MAG: alpha-1,2-fucosyltransferase [Dysgonamonadaceae bacterium]|jgi:hypothetical protein|nr:alpha-1,2-fucosyltransferase [Dysgonamonadaceae bacterium]